MLNFLKISFLLLLPLSILSFSCEKTEIIVPDKGYQWPSQDRSYWPTEGWMTSPLRAHQMDSLEMDFANQFAKNDPLTKALVVVKDGYLVYERYYGDGGIEESTNLWSVTKSFTSSLVGILMDQNIIGSSQLLMSDLMPDYPEFNSITLHHVLTQTTGLSWSESGPLWVDWISSEDWVASALARGQTDKPGTNFFYSSGNSHFLTSLVYYQTGTTPGKLAKAHLFDPMGIPFDTIDQSYVHKGWEDYKKPLYQTWRQDPKGIECASFGLYLRARDMAKFGFLFLNRGKWEDRSLISEEWIELSTSEYETNIYGRYSYGYQWWITKVGGYVSFLASGFGGQIIGVVPALDMVVVLKYEAESPEHPVPGSSHDDMHLFELVLRSVI